MLKLPFQALRSLLTGFLTLFLFRQRIPASEITELRRDLFGEAKLDSSFIVLLIGSGLIATFGLLSNSAAVIIGAMIIAPLMRPIRAFSFGILEGDLSLMQRSLRAILAGSFLTIGLAWSVSTALSVSELGSEVMARTRPNLLDLGVAITAGAISGYGKVEPKVGDALAGTAIAVALAPPLCVVGLGIPFGFRWDDWSVTQGSLLLFLTNWVGITLACMVVFIVRGYFPASTPRTRRVLGLTLGATGLLMIPLGLSLYTFLQESNLTATIRTILVRQTITVGQQVDLNRLIVDWKRPIPEVQLYVESTTPPTPKQVRLLEEFLFEELGRNFELVFFIAELKEVRGRDSWTQPNPDDE